MQQSNAQARSILLVDDDASFRARVRAVLGRAYRVAEAGSESEFRQLFQPYKFSLVILDLRLCTEREGLDLLREIYILDELQPVIMVSGYGDTETTIEALESGALMFLDKAEFTPALIARVVEAVMQQGRIKRRLATAEGRLRSEFPLELLGSSPSIRDALQKIRQVAHEPDAVSIIHGEPGTGRGLVARMIHDTSPTRSQGPFISCVPDARDAETTRRSLFGTGSTNLAERQRGLLEQAQDGVIFLLDLEFYPTRVLSQIADVLGRRTLSLGVDAGSIRLDLQLVAASPPSKEVAASLAQIARTSMPTSRLVEIYLPPLRSRREDVAILVPYFVQESRRRGTAFALPFSNRALDALTEHHWPGNVRELKAVVEYAEIRGAAEEAEEILPHHLPPPLSGHATPPSRGPERWDYHLHVARAETELVEAALVNKIGKTKAELAKLLGYNDRITLQRRMRRNLEMHPQLAASFPRVATLFFAPFRR